MSLRIRTSLLCASVALAGLLALPAARADFIEPPPMTVHLDANGITVDSGTGTGTAGAPLAIHFDGAGILHVKTGVPDVQPALVLDPHPEQTQVSVSVKMSADKRSVTMRSERLVATWNRDSTLSIDDASGRHLLTLYLGGLGDNKAGFMHAVDDAMYGIHGFNATEPAITDLLRQGHMQIAKAGEQGHAGAPFVWSTAGYGVLVDSDSNVDFRETLPGGKPDADQHLASLAILPEATTAKSAMDLYIIVGQPYELFSALAQLSGHTPLFPKWAMGFTNSQWGIDQNELLQIVDTYRAKHIPIDNFTLDFDWKAWGEDDYGEFRWNATKFPDGPGGKLKTELDQRGIHLTGIMKPRVHVDTVEGHYATAHDLWRPGEKATPDYFSHKPVKDIDFDKPAARAWFFNNALKHSFATGMVGWWNDEADNTPSNTQFLNMQRALYDGQRAISNQRVWSINRNFWLGSQRYAYGMWSGDIPTGFTSMAGQRARMLSAINVGAMQWGMDGGGFKDGTPTPENYARWIEFGAFTPIFRVHGDFGQKRQPWVYGPIAEQAATDAIRLRYALIPYIYSYEYQRRVSGVGLVRPLLFDWPNDPNVRNDVDAWLFGDYLLVSPVVEQGQTSKDVYLPAGRWTDWFSGKVYQGGQTVHLAIDSQHWGDIPLFIRQGAIIPTQPAMDYVGQQPLTQLEVDVFPDTQRSRFDYYDDDGNTYDYEHGAYFSQSLSVQQQGDVVHFEATATAGSFKPALKFYLLKIHGDAATAVTGANGALPSFANLDALQQSQGEGWASGHDRYGSVTWVRVNAAVAQRITLATKP